MTICTHTKLTRTIKIHKNLQTIIEIVLDRGHTHSNCSRFFPRHSKVRWSAVCQSFTVHTLRALGKMHWMENATHNDNSIFTYDTVSIPRMYVTLSYQHFDIRYFDTSTFQCKVRSFISTIIKLQLLLDEMFFF